MPDFMVAERDAGPRVVESGLSAGSPIQAHSGVPRQVFNDPPETTKLVCHYDPAFPIGDLSALPGEEMAN